MRRSFIASIVSLAFVSSACAASVEHSVTPTKLGTYFYVFSVSTNASKDNLSFHVTITSKIYDIYPDSNASVDMVIHKKLADGGFESSAGPVEPTIPVSLKKAKKVWTADFTVSRELLKNPDVCFVFRVQAHITLHGKTIPMPAADFYELRLQDFAKP